MMKKNLFSAFLLAGVVSLQVSAQHSPKTEVTRTPPKIIFSKILNTGNLKNQEVKMVLVTFAPGEISSPHRHPIPTFGYVVEGELESTFDGKVYHYKQGDAFYEEPNGLHGLTKNLSKTKPAKLLAYFVGDAGKPFIVPEKK